jgi:hypothetical protein
MLQTDASLPEVPLRPAPWELRGSGWIVLLRLPPGSPAREEFLPAELAGRGRHPFSTLMFVDYAESGCGPYRELLFVPGVFPFPDGRRYPTVGRILVSTWDSVVNGRNNWGIPKDRADFAVEQVGGTTRVQVTSEGRELAELHFERSRWAPTLPVAAGWLPAGWRSLAQWFRGRAYYYAPGASGRVRPGRLAAWRFGPGLFPDLAGARVLLVQEVVSFRMTFPVATIVEAGETRP